LDNANDSNLVINLIFLQCDSLELNTHLIHPEWCLTSNHASLIIIIPIVEEHIVTHKRTITKNSDEEVEFINEVIASFAKVDISNIVNISELEEAISNFANIVNYSWTKYSKLVNITKYSKSWWNDKCNQDLANYRSSKSIESWKSFQRTVKSMKREFFDLKIQENC